MTIASTGARSRAWVEVDLGALRANLERLRGRAGVIPMVKADAYGLGLFPVAAALRDASPPAGPWAFGVAAVAEVEALREWGWGGRVVVFSPLPPGEYARAARARATLTLSDEEGVARWEQAARDSGAELAFHVEVDTGMGRSGFPWREAEAWGRALMRTPERCRWEGTFTHFHSADEADLAPTDEQWRRFSAALKTLATVRGSPLTVIHVANSAAALRRPGYAGDLVRPGIGLYGGAAGPGDLPHPVAAVKARLALIREVPAGTTVGYGATYTARVSERWGTATIGYGDGLPRALAPAGGEALVRGRRVPIVGRISMDTTVLNLTAVEVVAEGDTATFVGYDGGERITVDEVATRCGTISYEILTGLTSRLPRIYLDDDARPSRAALLSDL